MSKNVNSLNKKLLAAAVSATKAKEIRELLTKGAEINCQNEWGMTPIMLEISTLQNQSIVQIHCTLLPIKQQIQRLLKL